MTLVDLQTRLLESEHPLPILSELLQLLLRRNLSLSDTKFLERLLELFGRWIVFDALVTVLLWEKINGNYQGAVLWAVKEELRKARSDTKGFRTVADFEKEITSK